MSEYGLLGEVEALLGDGAGLFLPPHLAALYEARCGADRRARLRVALLVSAVGTLLSLVFEMICIPDRLAFALGLRSTVGSVLLLAALAMPRLRAGWVEGLVFGVPTAIMVFQNAVLGELAGPVYADRYLLAGIGILAANCAVPPVPLAAAFGLALAGIASLAAVMGLLGGTLPLHDNLDIVVFALGALAVAMIVAARNEAGRHRAFLHALRDEMTSRELVRMNAELLRMTNTDALTGIDNRRKFEADLSGAWASRFESGLGVLIVDVDHFKQFNDSAGHAAGDACLRAVAQAIAGAVRAGELRVARYGGEEFAVLAQGIKRAELPALAERVRAAVEALGLPHPARPGECVTISVGAAWCWSAACAYGQDDLLRAADTALYAAKLAGRNRVVEDTDLVQSDVLAAVT